MVKKVLCKPMTMDCLCCSYASKTSTLCFSQNPCTIPEAIVEVDEKNHHRVISFIDEDYRKNPIVQLFGKAFKVVEDDPSDPTPCRKCSLSKSSGDPCELLINDVPICQGVKKSFHYEKL